MASAIEASSHTKGSSRKVVNARAMVSMLLDKIGQLVRVVWW
jgi:hypothetical protein